MREKKTRKSVHRYFEPRVSLLIRSEQCSLNASNSLRRQKQKMSMGRFCRLPVNSLSLSSKHSFFSKLITKNAEKWFVLHLIQRNAEIVQSWRIKLFFVVLHTHTHTHTFVFRYDFKPFTGNGLSATLRRNKICKTQIVAEKTKN